LACPRLVLAFAPKFIGAAMAPLVGPMVDRRRPLLMLAALSAG
jgi:hypothetical protein